MGYRFLDSFHSLEMTDRSTSQIIASTLSERGDLGVR